MLSNVGTFVLEIVTNYKQDLCLDGKSLQPRHLFNILLSFEGRTLGFVFVSYTSSFT